MTARIYLTGDVALEAGGRLFGESDFPGRQGKLAFVYLTLHRFRPVSRSELLDVIWPEDPPAETDAALSAILSKLRALLKRAGWSKEEAGIDAGTGTLGIKLPLDTWVDVEAAANALDESDGALRAGNPASAWSHANVVVSIARRPFLTDHDAPWIETRRQSQRSLLVRGLQCLAAASEASGQPSLAIEYASEVVQLEPFRETAYQCLMRLHASMGNRAEALRVFEGCRQLLREELGTSPSPQTEAVFLEILRAT